MNAMELFEATRAAYFEAEAKGKARDAAAVAAQNAKNAAEDVYNAACEAADASAAAAQADYLAAAETFAGLQRELGAVFGQVMPATDSRVRIG